MFGFLLVRVLNADILESIKFVRIQISKLERTAIAANSPTVAAKEMHDATINACGDKNSAGLKGTSTYDDGLRLGRCVCINNSKERAILQDKRDSFGIVRLRVAIEHARHVGRYLLALLEDKYTNQ